MKSFAIKEEKHMKKNVKLAIYGALIGDYFGCRWEFTDKKPETKEEALKTNDYENWLTDDSVCTLAIAKAVLTFFKTGMPMQYCAKKCLLEVCRSHPSSYGGRFHRWLAENGNTDTNSLGNGASMRVSPIGLYADTLGQAHIWAHDATVVSHSHPIAIVWAQIVAELVFLAKEGKFNIDDMKRYIEVYHPEEYKMISCLDLEDLHKNYPWHDEKSQTTVPQAIYCFLSSDSFEDALFRSLYIGGDADTIAAITCSIAAPYYGDEQVKPFLNRIPTAGDLEEIAVEFSENFLSE